MLISLGEIWPNFLFGCFAANFDRTGQTVLNIKNPLVAMSRRNPSLFDSEWFARAPARGCVSWKPCIWSHNSGPRGRGQKNRPPHREFSRATDSQSGPPCSVVIQACWCSQKKMAQEVEYWRMFMLKWSDFCWDVNLPACFTDQVLIWFQLIMSRYNNMSLTK